MPSAQINGARIYYEVLGSEEGAGIPLVLSHGGWTDTSHWLPNVGPLSRRRQVIVWDRRGCGRSDDPGEPHSAELWRDDLLGLLDHLSIQAASVGGCSYGALLALEVVFARPQLVRALVLESGTPDGVQGQGAELVPFPARGPELHRIESPALIVQGEFDPIWPPPVAERLQRGIAGSELLIVPNAAHVPHLDDPDLFNRTVEEFLSRVERAT